MKFHNIRRILHIHRVLVRHGLDQWLFDSSRLRPLRHVSRWIPGAKPGGDTTQALGVSIRLALEELGPVFVKFGQTLSTRRDLLPDAVALELIRLQDRVPPFPGQEARSLVEQTLGASVDTLFVCFDETPLASASVAQVHLARLPDGEEVVVKVLRPGIEQRIREDVALLYGLADWIQRYWREAWRLRLPEVVAEFEKTILDELDLVREAANATEIRRRFEASDILYIPQVYWPYTRRNLLVMERVSGIPIGDVDRLRREGVDLKLLAERGVEIFFTQVLRDNLFHADMHPGNIFATLDARYIAVDFGIVGSISRQDKHYIAGNFLAFFNRDYRRVAEMHIESGWVPSDTRVEEFESAIRAVCEPIFEKPLKDISYGHLLLRLFQVARRFNMMVQPQLVLLQKTLLNIEGLGRELYPELDLWQTAKPVLERWFREEMGPSASLKRAQSHWSEWATHWPEMPMLVHRSLEQTAQGRLALRVPELTLLRQELQQGHRKIQASLSGSALLVSGALLAGTGGWLTLGGVMGGAGLLLLLRALNRDVD